MVRVDMPDSRHGGLCSKPCARGGSGTCAGPTWLCLMTTTNGRRKSFWRVGGGWWGGVVG